MDSGALQQVAAIEDRSRLEDDAFSHRLHKLAPEKAKSEKTLIILCAIKTKIHLPVLQKKQAAGESDHVMDDEGELVSSSAHTCSDT